MRNLVRNLLGVLAAAACIFGLVVVAPTLSPMPTAGADTIQLGSDLIVDTGVEGADGSRRIIATTGITSVDHINVRSTGHEQFEREVQNGLASFIVNREQTEVAIQVCGTDLLGDSFCQPFRTFYPYRTAEAAPAKPAAPTEPVKVKCPEGSPTTDAVSLDQCLPAPPKTCPLGSAADTVPFGGQCTGPSNAVVLSITQELLSANVAVTNNSALPASCAYNATKTGGVFGVPSVDRNVSVGPNSTGTIDGLLWPPIGSTYRATVKCTATYDGKQVSIGESTQNVG